LLRGQLACLQPRPEPFRSVVTCSTLKLPLAPFIVERWRYRLRSRRRALVSVALFRASSGAGAAG
jgi:hypothetical protein